MMVKPSREQERALLEFIERHAADEVAAGCEPSGYALEIGVCPPADDGKGAWLHLAGSTPRQR
jgi:hypothetical protein